jgi:hypothetical protein
MVTVPLLHPHYMSKFHHRISQSKENPNSSQNCCFIGISHMITFYFQWKTEHESGAAIKSFKHIGSSNR